MARKTRTQRSNDDDDDTNHAIEPRAVAAHVRQRQRAIAEREASRLARPETNLKSNLPHADRKKSAVSSTPSGYTARTNDQPQEEWCGPFTIARKMIAEREEAKRLREEGPPEPNHPLDEAIQQLNEEKKRKMHPSLSWKASFKPSSSSTETTYSKRQKRYDIISKGRAVPSLFDLCCNLLADNFQYVESLGPAMPSEVRTELANRLVGMNKFDGESFAVVAEDGIESLELVDCSGITEDELSTRLKCILPSIQYLALGQAGRCFGKKAVATIVRCQPNLVAFSIGGAYLLADQDANSIVKATAPTSLEFKACPLLGPKLCESFGAVYSSQRPLVELSLEDLSLSEHDFNTLLTASDGLQHVRNLSLRHLEHLTDSVVDGFIKACSNSLEALDLSMNRNLSDGVLACLRAHETPRLHALSLSGLKFLTANGLEAFFTPVDDIFPSFLLHTIDLSYLNHDAVTDRLFDLIPGKLIKVNVQGSSVLSDIAMEYVVSKSKYTLEDLNVGCCPQISDKGLGYLIDGCGDQLRRVAVWGNAQLSDVLFDGNLRANDPTLEFVGVWMKNTSGKGTMR